MPPPATISDVTAASATAQHVNKAILGCLPRGRKMVPLFSELLQPTMFDISQQPLVRSLALGKRIPDECVAFPKGSKLFRFVNENGGVDISAHELPTHAMIGIPRQPLDFLAQACKLVHPTEMALSVN